ncbi:26S proteasome regulatory subunit 7 [Cucumispora dikerogammari]|nr:26S proteasome regulatory subunit 7 [Cucumispora dikerogammari]
MPPTTQSKPPIIPLQAPHKQDQNAPAEETNTISFHQNGYIKQIKALQEENRQICLELQNKIGSKEEELGMAPQSHWDILDDKRKIERFPLLQVGTINKVLQLFGETKYMVSSKHAGKSIVERGKNCKDDLQEGMRVGLDRVKLAIVMVLPRKIDSSVTMMQIEDKPNVSFDDVGGCEEEIKKVREVVEEPLSNPQKFINLGIDPPKGILFFGPPGTGKTLLARAVANSTNATFIRVIGSELVQKYIGEGARMVREIFKLARSKPACILFFDEVDAFGGTRFSNESIGEVQRTMLEILNQLDGFDSRGNVKVLMATNRPDTLDPALMRPGRIDRKIEFSLPTEAGREQILRIHAKKMSISENIRFDLIARLCDNATGAELRSVCTEAGMFAIRDRRRVATEKDFLNSVNKVIKSYSKFSSTPMYMTYN